MQRLSQESNFKDKSNTVIQKNKIESKPPIILGVIHFQIVSVLCGVHKMKQNTK